MDFSTSSAVLIGAILICYQLWGWEKRLSKQLLWLIQPEIAKDNAAVDRRFKEYDRLRLFLGVFPRGAAAQAKAELFLKRSMDESE